MISDKGRAGLREIGKGRWKEKKKNSKRRERTSLTREGRGREG